MGQLALMDAIVFFVIAMTISCVLFYYADLENSVPRCPSPGGQADPSEILPVFLHSSIGREIVLELDRTVHVSRESEVSICLELELDAISDGEDEDAFGPLNDQFVSILEAVCNPVYQPYLVCLQMTTGSPETILSLPGQVPQAATTYAASVEFPGSDGRQFLVILVLVPASLLEVLLVG